MKRFTMQSWLAGAALLALSACQFNVFDPLDSPSGDAQLKSAARACFDRGDLECARELYGKLSSSSADIKESELAFAILDENGASMGAFMQAFGDGAGGKGFTKLANLMRDGTGAIKRKNLFTAWQKTQSISGNPELRGIVRFVSAAAIAAATLAETKGGGGDALLFTADDLVANPAACKALTATTCAASTACDLPTNSILNPSGTGLGNSGFDASGAQAYAEASTPPLALIDGAISEISEALSSAELGASGKFGAGTGGFTSTIQSSSVAYSADASANRRCYRWLLVSNGIGEE